MGGFQYGRTYGLTFADGELNGLEVEVRSIPLGRLFEILDAYDGTTVGSALDRLKHITDAFMSVVISWNLQVPEGQPDAGRLVEPTVADLLATQPRELVDQMTGAWLRTAAGVVSAPLPQPSGDGEQSLEASIPMEVSSPAPVS
jgi:hypothetical protein